ncbi:MAG: hypothetical protein KKC84_00760, partial [Candidatus Omnitrophica bacterium]|nr:hypothetical protein [Candidatus Omnitrophota bacterium]
MRLAQRSRREVLRFIPSARCGGCATWAVYTLRSNGFADARLMGVTYFNDLLSMLDEHCFVAVPGYFIDVFPEGAGKGMGVQVIPVGSPEAEFYARGEEIEERYLAALKDIQAVMLASSSPVKIRFHRDILTATARDMLVEFYQRGLITEQEMEDASFLFDDIEYGDEAMQAVIECTEEEDVERLREVILRATIRRNIDRFVNLHSIADASRYDINIIGSTTQSEADYKQSIMNLLFGDRAIILSVAIGEVASTAGQMIGCAYAWQKAQEKARQRKVTPIDDLGRYIQEHKSKVALFVDAGMAQRFSPATYSISNARGTQHLVGNLQNHERTMIDAELVFAIVMQCQLFAATARPENLDVFWTSQMYFGSVSPEDIVRHEYAISKMVVRIPDRTRMNPRHVFQFGTAALTEEGGIVEFYGNKQFAAREKSGSYQRIDAIGVEEMVSLGIAKTDAEARSKLELLRALLEHQGPIGYDFGSFSIDYRMWFCLMEFYERRGIFAEIAASAETRSFKSEGKDRDYDPQFIQPLVAVLKELPGVELCWYDADYLRRQSLEEQGALIEDFVYARILPLLSDGCKAKLKFDSASGKLPNASMELFAFYLLNRDQPFFSDSARCVGYIDLGPHPYWVTYRNILDILNEKLALLSDMMGSLCEVDPGRGCEVWSREVDDEGLFLSEEGRRIRNVDNETTVIFYTPTAGKMQLTYDQVKEGVMIEGVYVRNAIIQGTCILFPGSRIENSVLNNVTGQVVAHYSYLEASIAPQIEARNSLVYHVIDREPVQAEKEAVCDAYRPGLQDEGFPEGQVRMRVGINYDPQSKKQGDDVTRTEGGVYTLSAIRKWPCDRFVNRDLERALFKKVEKALNGGSSPLISVKWLLGEKQTDMVPGRRFNVIINAGTGDNPVTTTGPAQGRDAVQEIFSWGCSVLQGQGVAWASSYEIEVLVDGNVSGYEIPAPNSVKIHPKIIRGPPELLRIIGVLLVNSLICNPSEEQLIHEFYSYLNSRQPYLRDTLLYLLRSQEGFSLSEAAQSQVQVLIDEDAY